MAIRKISQLFEEDLLAIKSERVTLAQILEKVHERGFGMLLFILALPMALPLPVPPGVNVILASPLIILTAQQALGRHTIWLPQKLLEASFSQKKFSRLIQMCLPWIVRLEVFVRPRLGFLTRGVFSCLIGLLGLIMALTVCIPLPLTNTVPSLGIACMAIGVIMRDGLAVLAGAFIGTLWVALLIGFVLFLGLEGIDVLKETIKSML